MSMVGRRCTSALVVAVVLGFMTGPLILGALDSATATLETEFQQSQIHGPITITSNAEFAAQAASEIWPGSGQLFDPYIISDLTIITDYTCIIIRDVTVYFEIRDCYLESVWGGDRYGISIENSEHGTVEGCTIRRAGRGINVELSSGIEVLNNDVAG
ncbi:MAG: right-handed parallel beta-helix repeat-containing protein, partial [Promethearchaeota archaeon]